MRHNLCPIWTRFGSNGNLTHENHGCVSVNTYCLNKLDSLVHMIKKVTKVCLKLLAMILTITALGSRESSHVELLVQLLVEWCDVYM